MGASYGNAGTIADYAVMPVGSPDVLRNLPSLLFDRTSPLSVSYTHLDVYKRQGRGGRGQGPD